MKTIIEIPKEIEDKMVGSNEATIRSNYWSKVGTVLGSEIQAWRFKNSIPSFYIEWNDKGEFLGAYKSSDLSTEEKESIIKMASSLTENKEREYKISLMSSEDLDKSN